MSLIISFDFFGGGESSLTNLNEKKTVVSV